MSTDRRSTGLSSFERREPHEEPVQAQIDKLIQEDMQTREQIAKLTRSVEQLEAQVQDLKRKIHNR